MLRGFGPVALAAAFVLSGCGVELPANQRKEQIELLRQIQHDTHAMCVQQKACER